MEALEGRASRALLYSSRVLRCVAAFPANECGKQWLTRYAMQPPEALARSGGEEDDGCAWGAGACCIARFIFTHLFSSLSVFFFRCIAASVFIYSELFVTGSIRPQDGKQNFMRTRLYAKARVS